MIGIFCSQSFWFLLSTQDSNNTPTSQQTDINELINLQCYIEYWRLVSEYSTMFLLLFVSGASHLRSQVTNSKWTVRLITSYVIHKHTRYHLQLSCDKNKSWLRYFFLKFKFLLSTVDSNIIPSSQQISDIHTLRVHYAHAAANLNSGYSKYEKVVRVHYFCTIALRTSRAVLARTWASRRVDLRERRVDLFFKWVIIFCW